MASSSRTSSAPSRMISAARIRSSGVVLPPMVAREARKRSRISTSRFVQSVSSGISSVMVKFRLFRIQDNLNYPEELVIPIFL